jgi:hypothetical protein
VRQRRRKRTDANGNQFGIDNGSGYNVPAI